MSTLLFDAFSAVRNLVSPTGAPPLFTGSPGSFLQSQAGNYQAQARQYIRNEVIYAAVKLISTSAAEPQIIGRRWRREKPGYANLSLNALLNRDAEVASAYAGSRNRHAGFHARLRNQYLIENRFVEEVPNHPLVKILNNPNPWTTRPKLMRLITMDTLIAGDRYQHLARNPVYGNIQQIYRLRPDRMRMIPDADGYPTAWAYTVNNQTVIYPAEDIIHGSEPHPLNDAYGLSPVDVAMPRADIDDAMREFLGSFYRGGGTGPGAILTTSGKLSESAKTEIRSKLKALLNTPSAFRETMILDQGSSTYQRLGLDRGLTDAMPKDVNAINEARQALPFAIPGSILGLLIGYESSSYANKRMDWQVFWDITETPYLSEVDDEWTKALCQSRGWDANGRPLPPEFSGIDEVLFDLGDIRALQEDEDDLAARHTKLVTSGVELWEEGRSALGLDPNPRDGIVFVPSGIVPTHVEDLGEPPEPPQPPPTVGSPDEGQSDTKVGAMIGLGSQMAIALGRDTALLEAPRPAIARRAGRPRLDQDPEARALWEEGERARQRNPGITNEQIAARLGIHERTWRRYRDAFGAPD